MVTSDELFEFVTGGQIDDTTRNRIATELDNPESEVSKAVGALNARTRNALNVDWTQLSARSEANGKRSERRGIER